MGKLSNDDKAGIYVTAIFHLAVIVVLLACSLGYTLSKENSFVLDFTKQEAREEAEKQEQLHQDIMDRLEELIAAAAGTPVRNVTVNASSTLKDDRNTDAEKLYKDAEDLARQLRNGPEKTENPEDYAEIPQPQQERRQENRKESYSGPSVLSWSLDGRKASRLPIPAYRCLGAGTVTVIITVSNNGSVINAKVQDDVSSDDKCLRDFAVRAARLSRFSASSEAPARQMGNIVYSFIAQ